MSTGGKLRGDLGWSGTESPQW